MIEFKPQIQIDYAGHPLFLEPSASLQNVDYCSEPQEDIFCQLNDASTVFAIEPRKGVKWDEELLRRAILSKYPFYHLDEIGMHDLADGKEALFHSHPDSNGNPVAILNIAHPEETIPVTELSQILVDQAIHDPKFTLPVGQPQNFAAPVISVPSQEKTTDQTPSGMTEIPVNGAIACVTSLAVITTFFLLTRRGKPRTQDSEPKIEKPRQNPSPVKADVEVRPQQKSPTEKTQRPDEHGVVSTPISESQRKEIERIMGLNVPKEVKDFAIKEVLGRK